MEIILRMIDQTRILMVLHLECKEWYLKRWSPYGDQKEYPYGGTPYGDKIRRDRSN